MATAIVSGVTRVAGSMMVLPLTETRPAAISARASDRLARASFDSARSSETSPDAPERRVLRREGGLPVVAKLQRDAEIFRSQRLHGALQIVFRRRADAHLIALDRGLHLLQLEILQVFDDLPGRVGRNALLQRNYLPHRAAGGRLDVTALEVLHRDVALDQPRLQHVPDRFEPEVVFGGERQRGRLLIEIDRGGRALEIEALADFLARLVDGVVDLGHFDRSESTRLNSSHSQIS